MSDRQHQLESLLETGQAALERGDFAVALADFNELTRLAPRAVVAWCGRAAAYYGVGDFRNSLAAASRARDLAPGDVRPLYVLGPAAFSRDDASAVGYCKSQLGKLDRATAKDIVYFWRQRLCERDFHPQAAVAIEAYVSAHDDDLEASMELVDALLNALRIDDADAALACAVRLGAPATIADAFRSRILLARGDIDGAANAARRVLDVEPEKIAASSVLAEIRPDDVNERDLAALRAVLSNPNEISGRRAAAGAALGRVLESRGAFDAAFSAFAEMKSVTRSSLAAAGVRYDRDAAEADMRGIIARHSTPTSFDLDAPAPRKIFVVGIPRSGSTLVEQVLSNHPNVASVGESLIIPTIELQAAQSAGKSGAETAWRDYYRREYAKAAEARAVVVDKNLFNFRLIGMIAGLDPGARFILTLRDPRAVALSNFRTNFMATLAWSTDLDDIAHFIAVFEELTRHWRATFADRIFVIQHEDFVRDFDAGVRRLLGFCGLSFDEACLDFHRSRRTVLTQSAAQVRRPVNADGVDRWRAYKDRLANFETRLARHRERLRPP
jgi:tetratricopeptide (TPR) repeat protein